MHVNLSTINLSYLSEVSLTWQRGLITEIKLSNSSYCDETQGYINLIQSQWPGTVNGCLCSSYLKRGTCNKGKYGTEKLCKDIPSTSSLPYIFWEKSSICGKPLNLTYFDLNLKSQEENCSSDTIDCGIVDTYKNRLCMDKNEKCPITSIRIVGSNSSISNSSNYENIEVLNSNKTLEYSNSIISNQSFLEFKIDEDTPCIFADHYNLIYPQYQLSASLNFNGCPPTQKNNYQTDTSTNLLDTTSKLNLYIQNGIEDRLSQLPNYFQTDSSQFIKLFTKSYTGLSVYCRSFLTNKYSKSQLFTILINTQKNVDDAIYKSLAAMIYNCVMVSLLLVLIVRYVCNNSCVSGKFLKLDIEFEMASVFVLGMGCLIFNSSASGNLNEIRDDLEILGSDKCGDLILIDVISSMYDSVAAASQLGLVSAIIGGILLFIPGITLVFRRKLFNNRRF